MLQLVVDNSKSPRYHIISRLEQLGGLECEFWYLVKGPYKILEISSALDDLIKEDIVRKRTFTVSLPGYINNSTQEITYYKLAPLYNSSIVIPKELRPLRIV